MQPTAKSLILDLLSTLRRGSMPVRALIAAGSLFGLAENNVRVNLARLRSAGLVESDERGRYRLGASASAVDAHVASWRRAAGRMRSWSGGWIAAQRPSDVRAAESDRRALHLTGFRELQAGLAVRPDNLVGGVAALRDELERLGLDPRAAVFELRALDGEREQRARAAWDAATLERGYAATHARLDQSAARLPGLPRERAMVESFLVGGDAIRLVATDPLLPPPIVERGALANLVQTLRRYDAAGRTCWAPFMGEHGVEVDKAAPTHMRSGEATAALFARGDRA